MSIKTAGFLAAALWLACALFIARCAGACALPQSGIGHDATAYQFSTCLHAARPERRACERSYVAYAGTVRK